MHDVGAGGSTQQPVRCARQHIEKAAAQTLQGLDWLNFFLADVQTGVGPFLAIYLAKNGWNEELVGTALAVGGIAGILPAALCTISASKRVFSSWPQSLWRRS